MATYPSKLCKGCSVVVNQEAELKKSQNADGTLPFPVFELAGCSCFRLKPDGCFVPQGEKKWTTLDS